MDQLLAWFGKDTYQHRLDRVRRFWKGEGRCLISLQSYQDHYRQTFDAAVIHDKAPRNLAHQATLPGVNLPTFFADFGTVSTAKYWGGTPRFDSTGENIFIDPVAETVADALEVTPKPVDDPSMDAARGVALYRSMCEQLQTDALWLRTPDFQGALNTAGLIMNQEEMLMAMYAEPEDMHELLDRVTAFLLEYGQYLKRETDGKICGNIWPLDFFPAEFGMSFTEDIMPLVSPEIYDEFGIPCLQKFNEAFGGLHIHCCGAWGRHAPALAASGCNIMAVEFHYPHTRIAELEPLADNTVFVPILLQELQSEFNSPCEYFRYLLRETPEHYRYWFTLLVDNDEARAFINEFDNAS